MSWPATVAAIKGAPPGQRGRYTRKKDPPRLARRVLLLPRWRGDYSRPTERAPKCRRGSVPRARECPAMTGRPQPLARLSVFIRCDPRPRRGAYCVERPRVLQAGGGRHNRCPPCGVVSPPSGDGASVSRGPLRTVGVGSQPLTPIAPRMGGYGTHPRGGASGPDGSPAFIPHSTRPGGICFAYGRYNRA